MRQISKLFDLLLVSCFGPLPEEVAQLTFIFIIKEKIRKVNNCCCCCCSALTR